MYPMTQRRVPQQPIWGLDTSGVWHHYMGGSRADCGYESDGRMVDGPRPTPPADEPCCPACRGQAQEIQFRECQGCRFEAPCEETVIRVYDEESESEWLCSLCAATPTPRSSDMRDTKRTICYVGNTILAEIARLGLLPRGPYR